MNRIGKTLLILILCLNSSFAIQFGSDRFQSFTEGTRDYGTLVSMGHNSKFANNLFFTDTRFVNAIAETQFPEGSGEKYVAANAMNFRGNYVMAAAKTDPRSPSFIMNSMDKILTNQNAEIELEKGLQASKLSAAQAGENASRYIAAEIITPEVGYYQTADNEQSFESAYDNVLLGRAEEALFKGDESSSLAYFNEKAEEFKKSDNKQMEATSYQKDGLMRSKKTAETFRDFFQMKAAVSQKNLDKMPTQESLLDGCKANTPQNENIYGAYFKAMPREEIAFYNFERPNYSFDFCEQYVHDESHYLIKNQPVSNQLQTLVEDSNAMAQGLDEISRDLNNKSLSVEEIAAILSENTAWKTLSQRAQAYKECGKTNCLEIAEKTLGGMVDYPGANDHKNPERVQLRAEIKSVIANKAMPGSNSQFMDGLKAGVGQLALNKKTSKSKDLTDKSPGEDWLERGDEPSKASRSIASQVDGNGIYRGKKFPRGGGYFRGEDGVLYGPSGKPVQGYHNSKSLDLFEIISRRYLIKMSKDQL